MLGASGRVHAGEVLPVADVRRRRTVGRARPASPRRPGSTRCRCPTTSSTPTSSTRRTPTRADGPADVPARHAVARRVGHDRGAGGGHRAHQLLHPRVRAAGPQPVRGGQGGGHRGLPVGRPGARSASAPAGCARSSTQLEQPFERRGARMEEQIEVLRTLWRRRHGRAPRRVLRLRPARDVAAPRPSRCRSSSAATPRSRCAGPPASATAGWASTTTSTSCAATSTGCRATATSTAPTDRPFEVQASIVDRLPTPEVCAELATMGVDTPHHLGVDDGGPRSSPRSTRTCGRSRASASTTSPRWR